MSDQNATRGFLSFRWKFLCCVGIFFAPSENEKRNPNKTHTYERRKKTDENVYGLFRLSRRRATHSLYSGISISFFVVSWSVFNHQKKRCKRIVRGCWTVFVFVCASIRCWGNISFSLNTRYLNKQNTIIIGVYRGKKWKIVIIFCE